MMKRNSMLHVLFAVVAVLLVSSAGMAGVWSTPAGVAVTVTNEPASAPFTVDLDLTVDSLYNLYHSSSYYAETLPWGNHFWAIYGAIYGLAIDGHFFAGPGYTTGGATVYPDFFPGSHPALDWGDGDTMDTAMIPVIGDGSGVFRGSFSHTYGNDNQRVVTAGVVSPFFISVVNNFGGPTRGAQFVATLHGTDGWWTTNFYGLKAWWFGSTATGDYPMAMQNTAVVYQGNVVVGASPIPTLSWLGMLLLTAIVAGAGIFLVTRR